VLQKRAIGGKYGGKGEQGVRSMLKKRRGKGERFVNQGDVEGKSKRD